MKEYKKIIISPHIDDEILGCFSVIKDALVVECGVDEFHIVSREERIKEITRASEKYSFDFILLENHVNHYEIMNLIDPLSEVINKYKPEMVFIPYPSYNQDHKIVYEACNVALRPHDINHFVKKVLVYEECQVFLWDYTHNINGSFHPNYFVPLNIEEKLDAYQTLKSQVRSFRSPELLKNIAFCRGSQSNMEYAEGFQILRWID